MPRVVHFEIHASDPERAVNFYKTLFDWQFQKWEGPMEYWMVITGPDGQPGINGGLLRRQGEIDDVVPRFAAQGRDHGEPARVLLEGRVVHPLLAGKRAEGVVCGAVIVPVKTKARRHTYRPHIDAQDGTTSALNCGS